MIILDVHEAREVDWLMWRDGEWDLQDRECDLQNRKQEVILVVYLTELSNMWLYLREDLSSVVSTGP